MTNESVIDFSKDWYLGNNRSRNLQIARPAWHSPLFLTTDYAYANDYADYGVWKVELKNETASRILDFNSNEEASILHWPQILIDQIQFGNADMNSIAADMYSIAENYLHKDNRRIYSLEYSKTWIDCSLAFYRKSKNLQIPPSSHWGREEDYIFLLQMWKDILDAGFDGFSHDEFGHSVLALFNVKCIDKISTTRIKRNNVVLEDKKQYLKKFKDSPMVEEYVRLFWDEVRDRVKAPLNDIEYWYKRPFDEFKAFVDDEMQKPSIKQQKDARQQAIKLKIDENDGHMLGTLGDYEVWYVGTYEAAKLLGRDYKNRFTHWCISSDDPDYWFENYDMAEFIFLIRQHLKNDAYDKVAIEFQDGGRVYNVDNIVVWDLNDNDDYDSEIITDDMLHEAWLMFKEAGYTREKYY